MGIDYSKRLNPMTPIPAVNVPQQLAQKLGQGLASPPTLANNRYQIRTGVDKVKQDMYVVLSTPIGRHMLQPDFGSLLPYMVFEQYTATLQSEMITATKTALKQWIPQIIVERVTIAYSPEAPKVSKLEKNIVLIFVEFVIKGTLAKESLTVSLSQDDFIQLPPQTFSINGRPWLAT